MEINQQKFLNFGGVTFVPISEVQVVRDSMMFNGMKLAELEVSDVLPGCLGWLAKPQDKRKPAPPPPPPPPPPPAAPAPAAAPAKA